MTLFSGSPQVRAKNVESMRKKLIEKVKRKVSTFQASFTKEDSEPEAPVPGAEASNEMKESRTLKVKSPILPKPNKSMKGKLLKKKKLSALSEAQANAKKLYTKGVGGVCGKKYNPVVVRSFCNLSNRRCGCGGAKNCYDIIEFETTRFYREMMYGCSENGRVTRFERNRFVYDLLERVVKEETDFRNMSRKISGQRKKVRLTYRLTCQQSGRYFRVCQGAFAGVLGISKGKVHEMSVKAKNGQRPTRDSKADKVARKKETSPQYMAILTFLETLADDLANHSPDCRVTELPSGFKIQFYDLFKLEWFRGLKDGVYTRTAKSMEGKFKDKPPSKDLFYRVWRQEFPHLKVPRRNNRFSKCDHCVTLKQHLESARQSGDQDEVRFWKECLYEHYTWVKLQRRKYHKHRRKAAQNPAK